MLTKIIKLFLNVQLLWKEINICAMIHSFINNLFIFFFDKQKFIVIEYDKVF